MMRAAAVSRAPVTLGRYRIVSAIGQGGMAVVYRGVDMDTGALVAVKTVAMTRALNFECFRREVHALSRMHHPGIVRIREQGIGQGLHWCAMDLVEGTPLRRLFSGGDDDGTAETRVTRVARKRRHTPLRDDALVRVLRILRRLCVPLAFLHGEGIVHRDLKPENVVVTSEDYPVIVDFGLASRFGGAISREEVSAEQHAELGTLGYMAPEQQRGELFDARVDIYAMGCMIYEALTGRVPTTPSPSAPFSFAPDIDPRLEALVMHLLAREPRDRLGYADSLAAALSSILEEQPSEPLGPPARTHLYRPSFAGRESALAELREWAGTAIPGVAVVRGESGVGKTRLVMEVARGQARVVTAECVPVAGATSSPIQGAPLHPLRPLLRFIADHCRVAGPEVTRRILGKRLRVLAAYEPDLLELATSEHPEPPDLSPQGARARLFADLSETLTELTRDAPLLLVIDDLQWSDELTLTFVTEQLASRRHSRVRVIGTYRSEVSTPALESLSASAQLVIEVSRLDDDAVAAVVSDMLAMPAPPGALIRFMRKHSEGNPFFVAEYLRTAAHVGWLTRDDAGRWQVVDMGGESEEQREQLPLPHSVRELVTQRLAGLSDTATGFIAAASVLGRDVEPALLAAMLHLDDGTELETLEELLRRQIFEELPSQSLRFSHDKLREVAYGRLADDERRALHARAASTLEDVRGHDPTAFGVVAHHLLEAALDARAVDWLEKAGEHALRTAGHGQARQFFERALSLDVPGLGVLRRSRWMRKVAEAAFGQGDIALSERRAAETLGRLTGGLPTSKLGWVWLLGRALARQGLAWSIPGARSRRSELERAGDLEAALTAGQLASIYYFTGDALRMVASLLVGVNLADRAGSPSAVVESHARLGYIAGVGGVHRAANHYFERARSLAGDVGVSGRALTLYLHAFYHLGLANWTGAEDSAREAVVLLLESGDRQDAEIAQTIAAHAVFFSGRIEDARRDYEQILESARGRGNRQHEAWGLYLLGRSDLAMGELERAVTQLESALALLLSSADRFSLVMCRGLLGQAYLARRDLRAAEDVTSALDKDLAGSVIPLAPCLHGYVGAAEVHLARVKHDRRALPAARVASRNLTRFARTFPMAEPAALRVSAECALLEGQPARAVRRLCESLVRARTLAMPFEEALAHASLSGLETSEANANDHRVRATEILTRIGARGELNRLVRDS